MLDNLKAYLHGLATDPEKLAVYYRDPEAAIQSAGLSPQEEAVLRDGNVLSLNLPVIITFCWVV